jgi:hypothetical protein
MPVAWAEAAAVHPCLLLLVLTKKVVQVVAKADQEHRAVQPAAVRQAHQVARQEQAARLQRAQHLQARQDQASQKPQGLSQERQRLKGMARTRSNLRICLMNVGSVSYKTMKKRIIEGGHKSGCQCGFCKNKGSFGKKKEGEDKKDEKSEVTAESIVNKMLDQE